MSALVLLLLIVFGVLVVSRQMTRDYSYTEQAFQQDIRGRRGIAGIYPSKQRDTYRPGNSPHEKWGRAQ